MFLFFLVDLVFREFFFDGLFSGFVVWEVEIEVCLFVRFRVFVWIIAVGDGDGVAYAEVYSFYDSLFL